MTNAQGRCINPAEITANDLLAYALGEAGDAARSHVERCAFCQSRAQEYVQPVLALSRGLFRRSCLPSMTIGEYVMGMLRGPALIEAASHLAECPRCLAESHAIQSFMAEADDPAPATGLLGALRRLIATPLATPAPAMAGLRGAGIAESVTYVADDSRVTLSAQSSTVGRSAKVIVGLVEQRSGSPAGAAVDLLRDGRVLATERVDEGGNFFFEDVVPATYSIVVRLQDGAVEIASFEVAATA